MQNDRTSKIFAPFYGDCILFSNGEKINISAHLGLYRIVLI